MKRKLYRRMSDSDSKALVARGFKIATHDKEKTISLPRGKSKHVLVPALTRAFQPFAFENFPMMHGGKGNAVITFTIRRTQSDDERRAYMVTETNHRLREGKGKKTCCSVEEAITHVFDRVAFYTGYCEIC